MVPLTQLWLPVVLAAVLIFVASSLIHMVFKWHKAEYRALPDEEAAREWSEAAARLGRDDDALAHLADAFAIPDPRASDADRAADRSRLGAMYAKLHESEKGLGDLLLAAYDRTATRIEAHDEGRHARPVPRPARVRVGDRPRRRRLGDPDRRILRALPLVTFR